jgi:hypothetical protein
MLLPINIHKILKGKGRLVEWQRLEFKIEK